jgi:SAM-dependent methyltransferase
MGIRARVERIPWIGRRLNRLLEVPSPFFHRNSPAEHLIERLVEEAIARGSGARVLNIGSRSARRPGVVNLDIVENGNADVIGDATFMPFADNSFDLIINVAVMEHVRAPHVIAAECQRVLKPRGKIYCAIPFFQMYHADPIDMQRYTITGVAELFKDLEPLETGVEVGPASALSLTLREFLAILFCFNSKVLYNLLQVFFGYVTYPIKFLDYFLARNKFAFMIACSVYFVGRKPEAAVAAPTHGAASDQRVDAPIAAPTMSGPHWAEPGRKPIGVASRRD